MAGDAPIWLIGCGNMGGALLRRWLAEGLGPVAVIDPAARNLPPGVEALQRPPETGKPDIVVLAVKPQVWASAVLPLAGRIGPMTLVISVMAGIRTEDLARLFPGAGIVRAMPNTPALVGQGMTALFTRDGDLVQGAAEALFQPVGQTLWLSDEAQFDTVTAISGSGPAYVFHFIEALAKAGEANGLDAAMAMRLARQTVIGAAALAAHDAASSAATLRERVTSPGGTTAAGLGELMPALAPLLEKVVAAAAERSRQLG
ncbi:MAG: pyrroline-5-carboxylate reductase [Sandarakinorhabdus sp.]|nr:pyrroline-5-carboxylate reductase [Sandarakinorhabdus sp.]